MQPGRVGNSVRCSNSTKARIVTPRIAGLVTRQVHGAIQPRPCALGGLDIYDKLIGLDYSKGYSEKAFLAGMDELGNRVHPSPIETHGRPQL